MVLIHGLQELIFQKDGKEGRPIQRIQSKNLGRPAGNVSLKLILTFSVLTVRSIRVVYKLERFIEHLNTYLVQCLVWAWSLNDTHSLYEFTFSFRLHPLIMQTTLDNYSRGPGNLTDQTQSSPGKQLSIELVIVFLALTDRILHCYLKFHNSLSERFPEEMGSVLLR